MTEHTKGLGQRMQAASGPIANYMGQQAHCLESTLIHGDFKAANLFFAGGDKNSKETSAISVAAVDFQSSGADGVGPEDVACLLFPDARANYFDQEMELLKIHLCRRPQEQ
jgi:Ser/Thr protein kinase RdoA (MazF antagonist)